MGFTEASPSPIIRWDCGKPWDLIFQRRHRCQRRCHSIHAYGLSSVGAPNNGRKRCFSSMRAFRLYRSVRSNVEIVSALCPFFARAARTSVCRDARVLTSGKALSKSSEPCRGVGSCLQVQFEAALMCGKRHRGVNGLRSDSLALHMRAGEALREARADSQLMLGDAQFANRERFLGLNSLHTLHEQVPICSNSKTKESALRLKLGFRLWNAGLAWPPRRAIALLASWTWPVTCGKRAPRPGSGTAKAQAWWAVVRFGGAAADLLKRRALYRMLDRLRQRMRL